MPDDDTARPRVIDELRAVRRAMSERNASVRQLVTRVCLESPLDDDKLARLRAASGTPTDQQPRVPHKALLTSADLRVQTDDGTVHILGTSRLLCVPSAVRRWVCSLARNNVQNLCH